MQYSKRFLSVVLCTVGAAMASTGCKVSSEPVHLTGGVMVERSEKFVIKPGQVEADFYAEDGTLIVRGSGAQKLVLSVPQITPDKLVGFKDELHGYDVNLRSKVEIDSRFDQRTTYINHRCVVRTEISVEPVCDNENNCVPREVSTPILGTAMFMSVSVPYLHRIHLDFFTQGTNHRVATMTLNTTLYQPASEVMATPCYRIN